MIAMQLSEAANAIDGELIGSDRGFEGVSTDTRSLTPNQLFFALRGPRFDAHDKLDDAANAGAAGAVVEHVENIGLGLIHTSDCRRSLGRLARNWRSRFEIPLLAVTGSSGKTTVKQMLAAILQVQGEVLATRGNLNNDIGLPLTLFELRAEHDFAVIEMGANRPGDIAWLGEISGPLVAVITLVAPSHLEGFGSIEAIARAKGEIISALGGDGFVVINCEDPYASLWTEMAGERRIVTFGRGGMITAKAVTVGADKTSFVLRTDIGETLIKFAFKGRHNVQNALAAAAAARAVDVTLASIRAGLERAVPVRGRLQLRHGPGGARLLDDSYNANPASLQAALDVLSNERGHKWLVLGDMAELGDDSENYHREAARAASRAGVQRLFTVGALAKAAALEFDVGAEHFSDLDSLTASLPRALTRSRESDIAIPIKGSRVMALDKVADILAESEQVKC